MRVKWGTGFADSAVGGFSNISLPGKSS